MATTTIVPLFRELRDSLDDIRHEVSNHDTELRMYQEKLANQDNTVENLRQQMTDHHQAQKDQIKGTIETKINALEATTKGLVADLKVLQRSRERFCGGY